jgi:prepilin-type N-terminal cleavage/methylation domain-containing protein
MVISCKRAIRFFNPGHDQQRPDEESAVRKRNSTPRQNGFTLTELTIVLVIVALLIGGLMMPLSAQRDIQNINETRISLAEIKEALLGFAVINGRLPCPSTTTDPASVNYGIEDATCNNIEGYLPWKSLGVSEIDPWGSRRNSASEPFTGFWRYRVDGAFSVAFTLNTVPSSNLVIQESSGSAMTQASPNNPVAIIYSNGPDRTANGQNVDTDTGVTTDVIYQGGEMSSAFDDILLWIGRPILFNRMISAGKLP